MRSSSLLLAATMLLSATMWASAQTGLATQPETAPVLHTSAQMVLEDVTVEDVHGRPVQGLKASDFAVTEDGRPQMLEAFEEHSTANPPKPGREMPPLPPGTFTDYTPLPASGPLNVLLLDSLNTPMKDQAFVRYELAQFVKKVKPGTQIAIFGLSTRLFMLQGFSADPAVLKNAVEHKLIPRASVLLRHPVGTDSGPDDLSDAAASLGPQTEQAASVLNDFEAQTGIEQTQMRLQFTLDAFNTLARYLAAFPGRKNLIWFSGAFPIDFLADPALANPFVTAANNEQEFHETTDLLAHSQVAVYPVDARGLINAPMYDASRSGAEFVRNPQRFSRELMKFNQSQAEEHMTMQQLAEDTGGQAAFNTNDLATAVERAIAAGSNYYTLAYSPADKNWNGGFRKIRVTLTGSLAAAGYKLAYRRGYYADNPEKPRARKKPAAAAMQGPSPANGAELYARAAVAHGAPAPQDILFKARVLPTGTEPTDKLAPNNSTDPLHPIQPPFRQFAVDIATLTNACKLTLEPNGRRTGAIEFTVRVFNPDGRLLNFIGETVKLNLTPDTYERFQHGMAMHLEISTPSRGQTYLRIAVHDLGSNRFGVVELPTAEVARLQPVAEVKVPSPAAAPQH